MPFTPEAVIDLSALRHNLARVRQSTPGSRVFAVIKANGYGHGLHRVAGALAGSDGLAVARSGEAIALREAGVSGRILVLGGCYSPEELELASDHTLEVVVHQFRQIELLESMVLKQPLRVWIKLDTGMHRLGLAAKDFEAALARVRDCPAVSGAPGLLTHLANADDRQDPFTERQCRQFLEIARARTADWSIANSAGILGWPVSHGGWVRPGIMLYGASPFAGGRGPDDDLLPVMTLRTRLVAVQSLQKGDAVGYGGTWVCPEPMRVGVAAIGYGDGYPRHVRQGTPVLVNGEPVPLIGCVSMDMVTLDLRAQSAAQVGDTVTLWGCGLPVEEIADCASTIAYELLCGVSGRVRFIEEQA